MQRRTTAQTIESAGAVRTDYDEIQQEVIMMRHIETTDAPSGPASEMPYSRHRFQPFFFAFFSKSLMFYFRIVLYLKRLTLFYSNWLIQRYYITRCQAG